MTISFRGHTVVITGAGGGLGKAYSLLFASRGANVVVNDFNGEAAQKLVHEIVQAGGKAVMNVSSVTDGQAVIKTALDSFGNITVLINNAGFLRDKGFKNMVDKEWDEIIEVHVKGAFACTKAAWPHFKKQKFGRIINTASAAGLYGNFGQANYSAAKMSLVGFTKTLAIEGAKYNIKANVIAPMAASQLTATVMPPEMLANLKPEFVAPFVAVLASPDTPDITGRIFEVGAGFAAEVQWQRSKGAFFRPDASFTPSAVKARWEEIADFTDAEYTRLFSDVDMQSTSQAAQKQPPNIQSKPEVGFEGRTAIVTGAGNGLGRQHALLYARLGANVVVNDISEQGANAVVDEISKAGGKATAVVCSAEDGEAIVKTALEKFGGVHILVANAGFLRDKSFQAMSEQEWDIVMAIHLRATYKCAKAVWPIFQKQSYGRIVTTTSQYSTAKAGIIGFTKTLALEGKKHNILSNAIAPSAATTMTTAWPREWFDAFKPDYVSPVVGYLTSEANENVSGQLFEVGAGWVAQTRCQRSAGYGFPTKRPFTPEEAISKWDVITKFDESATYPTTTQEAMGQMMTNFNNTGDANAKL